MLDRPHDRMTVHTWQKDPLNPILPPGPEWFDVGCCMNPHVIRRGDEYLLYYAGADKAGRRRICLAVASVHDVHQWRRLGPLFDLGSPGSFDEFWCVLPCVHRINGRWHLYYTGRSADRDTGLQAFRGMGLATSEDLLHWTRHPPCLTDETASTHSTRPVLCGDGFPEFPANRGIAGGGRIQELPQPDGRILYRMHYTLATGTPSKDLRVDQAKCAVVAHSFDGLDWFGRRILLRPRPEADYENAAVIALNVWPTPRGWRAIYAGIGTRFGAYSICEALSADGETWDRGRPGENLSLPPTGSGWESRMTEYPNMIEEEEKMRLFYCGNGYGATGIGTALAEKLD